MATGITTYTDSDVFSVQRPITQGDMASACENISADLAAKYGGDWLVEPEPITEGGLIISKFPGKTGRMYKSMRFTHEFEPMMPDRWPAVTAASGARVAEWQTDAVASTVIFEPATKEGARGPVPDERCKASVYLKAFYDAPAWTRDELNIIAARLVEAGFQHRTPVNRRRAIPVHRGN